MSIIAVVVKKEASDVAVLKELHKLLGGSLMQIRSAISSGLPVVEMEIFNNQYEEKSDFLRSLISFIRRSEIDVDIYELPEGDCFETSSVREESLISEEILENILNSSDDEFNRQLDT